MITGQAMDQQMLTFLRSTAAQYESETLQVTLSNIMYPELVQVYTGMNPNADSIVTLVGLPGVGRMVPLANGGMDFPNVSNSYKEISAFASSFVCGYMWTLDEINKARYMGIPLERDRVGLAYEVAEREKERFVCFGDETQQWRGLFSNTDPNCIYLTTGDDAQSIDITPDWDATNSVSHKPIGGSAWSKGGSHEAYTQICRMFTEMRQTSRDNLMADTLLISVDKEAFLHEPYRVDLTGNNAMGMMSNSVLSYLRMNNPYTSHTGIPLRIKTVYDLPHGTCILYNSSIKTMRFIIAQDLMFTGPQQYAYEFRWFGKIKVGGIQYLNPKNIVYLKGI